MTKEEMLSIFELLEREFNKTKIFYFKLDNGNQIGMHLKTNNKRIAQFYVEQLIKVINVLKNEVK